MLYGKITNFHVKDGRTDWHGEKGLTTTGTAWSHNGIESINAVVTEVLPQYDGPVVRGEVVPTFSAGSTYWADRRAAQAQGRQLGDL